MLKVGLISDTHHFLDPQIPIYFGECDEIWHAGDLGTIKIAEELEKIAPVTAVYGNIDGQDVRKVYPLHQRFMKEGLDIWMTHIGGSPGRYALPVRKEMDENPPDIFICGHSHILKIARDQNNHRLLYVNPGAAGRQGFQLMRTIVRFTLNEGKVSNMEVINLGTRTDSED